MSRVRSLARSRSRDGRMRRGGVEQSGSSPETTLEIAGSNPAPASDSWPGAFGHHSAVSGLAAQGHTTHEFHSIAHGQARGRAGLPRQIAAGGSPAPFAFRASCVGV